MFTVLPIRSGLPYDPWADIDDNGKIDMKDIGNVAAQFMTSGDPTKNVNVTNWPITPLHNYTDAEEYTLVDVSRMVNGTEHGMYIISGGGFFAFSPKQNFTTVTNFCYMILAYKEGVGLRFYNFTISINGVTVDENHLEITDYYPTERGGYAPLGANYIHSGINYVSFIFQEWMFVLKMSVYIEYQYQA